MITYINKIFGSKPKNTNTLNEVLKEKSINDIVDEIHDTFYTEVDRLKEWSLNIQNIPVIDRIDVRDRLLTLGFDNAKDVKNIEKQLQNENKIKVNNEQKQQLLKAINYFSFTYPNYKFINSDSVSKICSKYNLIMGDISAYTGEVPLKNLEHIEKFKIKDTDRCFQREVRWNSTNEWVFIDYKHYSTYKSIEYQKTPKPYNPETRMLIEASRLDSKPSYEMYPTIEFGGKKNKDLYTSYEPVLVEPPRFDVPPPSGWMNSSSIIDQMDFESNWNGKVQRIRQSPMKICAPRKEMILKSNQRIKGNKIIDIPDPVVLYPVYYEGIEYYLIVTAWGQEALDEDVVNHKFN